jgi:catechol 2,3-dioxygenase-like lactoylglutathione lyase family enzyme
MNLTTRRTLGRLLRVALPAVTFIVGAHTPARAQLNRAKDGPIVYGHHHVNVTSVDAHKKFWVAGLGGTPVKIGTSPAEVVRFPNVLVFLTARAPSGGTKGTTVNHVGFETPNIRAAVDRLKAAGFPMVTRAELPPTYDVKDDLGQRPGGNIVAFVMGPDETKVELIENKAIAQSIVLHHIHFAAADVAAMKAWYVKTFAARPGTRAGFEAADLPGVNLTFSASAEPVVPTRGRTMDHIGFEVRNLEAFCKQLEASGITLDRPYTKVPALGIAIAFLTDPWGTYIELTEGLSAVP